MFIVPNIYYCGHTHTRSLSLSFSVYVTLNGGAENASTGKRKYEKCKYNANLQSDKKKFGTSQVSVVHFQVGWASGLQVVFSEIT